MLKLTRKASADLDDIFEHYKERLGAEQAQAIVHDVVAESRALERSASAKEACRASKVGELALKRWPFLTTFQVTPESVQILRFLHSSGQPINQPLDVEPAIRVSSSVDVSGLRCYDRLVDGLTYRVPRGISRDPRSAGWLVRVVRNKQVALQERFTDAAFGSVLGSLEAAIIHLSHSGLAWLQEDVLTLDEHCAVHWRKRSGVGLCAVSYVSRNGPGRGETLFVSTWKRVESGRGLEKFRAKLVETLLCSHTLQHGPDSVSDSLRRHLDARAGKVMASERFKDFLRAGQRKAERVAVSNYLSALN
ncbi:type II toxin-antitoxin system RelE/ParE family toxin [Pseudomonas sp. LJDD11]|uniref:type II toxin-antitoxin system RelE/ParE family toxin n=1 Tax=unclassified Pseudomonas TaxID=196821 RepID=UPI0020977A0F|nr:MULTISPECIES: type II toxin-antitoxin system RelE/ParE family toxin [unclassified Pseudomonas]MCO8164261.1 type II toxin-antitoxin system RelE/ParE family toxin [Pseudomonas sp. 21LCFQ010]MCQ9425652.1 type II toxin-antitoxin system RelE/ParE family toxin [Pseudomonas sp. LJDD11]